ncbi:MAG: type II toxin-antitoxin system RelE/ParE family toxin [Magnetococcales bacterium]|nr:type II toxin-antitoxin system RelE/ParE family toxin [Magnetococcales bacterium]
MNPAVFTGRARRDILMATQWMAKDNPLVAQALREAIKQAAILLGNYPLSGRERPDLVNGSYRFLAITGFSYVLVYDSLPRPPIVVRVIHGARDLPALMDDF